MMRRLLLTLIAALTLTVGLVGTASAAPAATPCVPSVTVSTFTDADTGNIMQATKTITCDADGNVVDDYTYETLYYRVGSERRGGFQYLTPAEYATWQANGGNAVKFCGSSRAWNRCCP